MKKFLAILLIAVMVALTLTGCGSAANKNSVDAIKKAGKLTMYTEAGFAPYEFIADNKVVGVDIAIMQKVADDLGVELEVTDVNFDSICASVQSGKVAVGAAGITIRDDRKKQVLFSKPYSSTEQYLVVMKDAADDMVVEDLAGKKIGVQNGTTSDFMIEDLISDGTLKGSEIIPYQNPSLAAAGMSSNKVDAVVTDKLTAQIIVENNKDYQCYALVKKDGSPAAEVEEYGIAVALGNTSLVDEINKVLDKIMSDGTLDKWMDEYTELAKKVGA